MKFHFLFLFMNYSFYFSLIPNIKMNQGREKNEKILLPSIAISLSRSYTHFCAKLCVFFLSYFNENYFSRLFVLFFFSFFCSCEIPCFNYDGSFFKERTSILFVSCEYAFFLLSLFTDAAAIIDAFFFTTIYMNGDFSFLVLYMYSHVI